MPATRHTAGLIRLFVRHPNAANLLMLVMILMGVFSLWRMNTQFFPTVQIPAITVSIAWPGASAEDVEENIVEALEPELRFLDGIDELTAFARESGATINMEFESDADMQKALSDVEQAVANVTTLPDDSEKPVITRVQFYEHVASIALSGPYSELQLKRFAKELRDGLLDAGIDRVVFEGFRDEEIWVMVPPRELRRLDLTLSDIAERISRESRDIPSGILEGDFDRQLRALGEAETAETVADIEVRATPAGQKIRLRDIAAVEDRFEREAPVGFQNGNRAIKLTVQRAITADTLEAAETLDRYLAEVTPTLPPDLNVTKFDVRAELVSQRINLLLKNGAGGLVLVLIVLFVFLNARIAFWVAVGIPTAMMATLMVMWVSGQSINMVSLFALILTLGIIVDDAIVVGEHTATLRARGIEPVEAAERGAMRMLLPVFAATLTTQAAFMPLFLVREIIGDIMEALPLVVVAVLIASVVESFLILPGHLRHALDHIGHTPGRFRRWFDDGFARVRDGPFRRLALAAFEWRYTTISVALAALIISAGLLAGGRVGFKFFPSPEPEMIEADVVFAPGTPLAQEDAALKRMEQAARRAEGRLSGGAGGLIVASFINRGKAGTSRGDQVARIEVQLVPAEERSIRTTEMIKAWRTEIPPIPGVEQLAIAGRRGGPPGRDVHVEFRGGSPAVLKKAALELRQVLAGFPGLSSISDDLPYGKPELILELTHRGTAMGFTTESVGRQVRNAFEGGIARKFARGDEEVTIRVKELRPAAGVEQLRRLYLRSPGGEEVALSEIVTVREKAGFSVIQRRDGKPVASVFAEVDQAVTDNNVVVQALGKEAVPRIAARYGLDYAFRGRAEETAETFSDLKVGAGLALVVIYIILASVFGSYIKPLIVMAIIPFGLIGAIIGHKVMGFPLTILSFFGLLGLSGILVNDSIILVNQVQRRMEEGESLRRAAVGGAQDRLRAVLLTSLTTIGGLTPLLFEKSLQAQFLLPMAITLVFGLGVATALVLLLVPACLGFADDLSRLLGRLLALGGAQSPARGR